MGRIITIYPNPAKDVVNFTNINNVSSITILNTVGQTLLNKANISSASATINISNFENGLYFINLTKNNGEKEVMKLVKY